MRQQLRDARARGGYARWERWTDGPLLALALLFLFVILAPIVLTLQPWQDTALNVLSGGIWVAFTVDYLVRLYLSASRWAYVRTHLLDLLIIVLPLLRPLRALRLLRLARGLSVLGFVHQRAGRSLHARAGLYVSVATGVVVMVLAAIMYDVERASGEANITTFGDAVWWAITTVTTVGYGDRYPTTTVGRLVAVALMLVGIALLGVITASVAAWFVGRLQESHEAEERTEATVDQLTREVRALRVVIEELARNTGSGDQRQGAPAQP